MNDSLSDEQRAKILLDRLEELGLAKRSQCLDAIGDTLCALRLAIKAKQKKH